MSAGVESVKAIHSPSTDEELVQQFKNGDRESLETLVRAYIPRTYNRVHTVVPESDAADVVQDIFVSFIESIGNFENGSNFAAWFRSITKRRIADYYRRASRYKRDSDEDQIPEVDDTWEKIDDELTVRKALREMPERSKEILLMKFIEGLSLIEIARRLGLTYEATRSRYRRGIDMLKEKVVEF